MALKEKTVAIAIVVFAIGFNLWLYRLEPTTLIDPNDNAFQFALVARTNQIWNFVQQSCANIFSLCIFNFALLFDHWVPNWAEGYNLPYYYAHIPQIIIVGLWRLTGLGTLFQFYHWIIYLLLSFFPLSLFLSLRVIGLPWLTAGAGAVLASHLSTDGLYGLDPASFLWRGYGLSGQLFAMIFLPLALAYAYRGKVLPAILFLAATTTGHLGIGMIAFLSLAITVLQPKKLLPIYAGALTILGYWIIPAVRNNAYHNISIWDPIWKFDSYGAGQVLKNFLNGDLFDFGRFPVFTLLVLIGLFVTRPFALLFVFWLLMYFGRATWGPLFDLLPGMREFHLSRFIVGVHLAGLFLAPIALQFVFQRFGKIAKIAIIIGVALLIYPQTIRYAAYNDVLIKQANKNYLAIKSDTDSLITYLVSRIATNPGRVYAGRGGNWGREFKIAETPYYIYLSTFGIPTVLWLPQTWSPNSDTEQYFSEEKLADYDLYNIRYIVAPPGQTPQPFWQPLRRDKTWTLYEVATNGYFTTGVKPAVVASNKENFINIVRLWIQSDYPQQGFYPEMTFTAKSSNLQMLDEATYRTPDNTTHSLFAEPPSYQAKMCNDLKISSQEDNYDMIFKAKIEKQGNDECLVVLKQTFHPSWKATVDGKKVKPFSVFPFFTAIALNQPGEQEVIFYYQPKSPLDKPLYQVSN